MKKAIKKYITKLHAVTTSEPYDVRTVAMIIARLNAINTKIELYHFILTTTELRNFAKTASDFKFLDRVLSKLKKIHKGS